MKSRRFVSLAFVALLVVGLLPAGAAGVRAASPSLVDPDPNDYAIVIQGGSSGLVPEHIYACDLDPQHTSTCGPYAQYGYPAKYAQYGYPPQTVYSQYGYPAKYGQYGYPPLYGYPAQYGQYGYPAQYGQYGYPPNYATPPTLPDSTVACTTSPSGASVVVGAQLSCTAVNTFFSSGGFTTDAVASIGGGASLVSSSASSGTLTFTVALNTAGSATIAVTYAADNAGSNAHQAATHYLDTINGSTTVNGSAIVTTTGAFTIKGNSVSITGLDPMSVWLASDALGQDTVTVTSASKASIALTLSGGCSTSSASSVVSATVASGGTQTVYALSAGTCSITGTSGTASTTVTAAMSLRDAPSPVSNAASTGSSNGLVPPMSLSFTTTHYVNETVDSSVSPTVAGATVSYSLVSGSSTAGLCALNTTTGSLTFNLGVISGSTAGTCVVRATQAATAAYAGWTQDATRYAVLRTSELNGATISRTPATGTIVAGASFTASYAGTTYGLLTWQTSGPCNSLSTSASATINVTASGTCTVSLYDSGSSVYKPATSATLDVSTSDASQTISFSALPSGKFVGDAPFALTASATSGLTVSFTSNSTAVCTVSGSTVTIKTAGTCSITASQAGGTLNNITYTAATPQTNTTTISTKSQTITFNALPTGKFLGDAPFAVSASTNATGLTISFTSNSPTVCTVSGSTVTIVAAGSCSITASQAGGVAGDGYTYAAASSQTNTTTILKGTQVAPTLAANSAGPYTPGTSIGLTVSGGSAKGAFAWSASGICSVSNGSFNAVTGVGTLTLTFNNGGLCSVTASYQGNVDWDPVSSNTLSLTVAGYGQAISFTQPTSPVVAGSDATLSASSTDTGTGAATGLAISFAHSAAASSPSDACSVSGTTAYYELPGTCALVASQAGGTGSAGKVYGAALSQTKFVTIESSAQTISTSLSTAWSGNTETLGSTDSIGATSSSGLPVTAVSFTPGNCAVSGSSSPWTVRFFNVNLCSIRFTAAGGTVDGREYADADAVSTSTSVTRITAPSIGTPNATFSFNASGANGGASKAQLTSPTILGDGGAYRSADGAVAFRLGCGASPAPYLDSIEITRTLYIDGVAQGSASDTVACAGSAPYTLSGLSNGRYVFTAKAERNGVKSSASTIATVEVGSAPVVNFSVIAGALTGPTPAVRYLKITTPTLYWNLVTGSITGQTLVRYSAAANGDGSCPNGAAAGATNAPAGWSADISYSSNASPATLAAGARSFGFAGAELPERCVQFAHIGANGLFTATAWSGVYLIDKTNPSITPTIAGLLNGIAQSCVIVTVQACRIEPGAATISVTGTDISAAGGAGSGVARVRLRGSDFDTSNRDYSIVSNRSRSFTIGSGQTSLTLYATLIDRAGNQLTIPVSFSVAAETEPVFNAVVDLVDCANPETVIRPDFAEQGFLYWPVGAELCLVPRVDMAVKGLRYVNGVAQESVFVGTLTAKLTGSASSANDTSLAQIGKWPDDKIGTGISFYDGAVPSSLTEARALYTSGDILYKKVAEGTASAGDLAAFAGSVLRFRIDAETSIDNADSVPYVAIPFEFKYVYGWLARNTVTPLLDYRVETASITLKVVAVNLGAGE